MLIVPGKREAIMQYEGLVANSFGENIIDCASELTSYPTSAPNLKNDRKNKRKARLYGYNHVSPALAGSLH